MDEPSHPPLPFPTPTTASTAMRPVSSRGRWRAIAAVAGSTALAGAVLAGSLALVTGMVPPAPVLLHDAPERPPEPPPAAWDERVAFAVDFIEAHKGAPFEHPVAVEFQAPEDFETTLRRESRLTAEDRRELDDSVGLLRALGLLRGPVDLEAALGALQSASVLAYYDAERDRIRVRGDALDVRARVIVVHELTHAWQDQHHDLERMGDLDAEASLTFRSLVEGDATVVAGAWVATMSEEERRALEAGEQPGFDTPDGRPPGVPAVLLASQAVPYALGPPVLHGAVAVEGPGAADRLLATPPAATDRLLQPWRALAGPSAAPPRTVTAEPLPPGAVEVGEPEPLGPLTLYLALAQLVSRRDALAATDRWVADVARTYRDEEGAVCLAVRIAADDTAGADLLDGALRLWDRQLGGGGDRPGGAWWVEVTREADDLTLTACDPGEDEMFIAAEQATDSLSLAVTRARYWEGFVLAGWSPDEARCLAVWLTENLTDTELAEGGPASDSRDDRLPEAVDACTG